MSDGFDEQTGLLGAEAAAAARRRGCCGRCRGHPYAVLFVVFLCLFMDAFVYNIMLPYVSYYVQELHVTKTIAGLLLSSYAFVMAPTVPIFGLLSDRFGRFGFFLFGLIGLAAACVGFIFVNTVPTFVVCRMLQGLSAALTWSTAIAMVQDAFPANRAGRAVSIAMAGNILGLVSSPPLAGVLLEYTGYSSVFILCSALIGLDLLLRLSLLPPKFRHRCEQYWAARAVREQAKRDAAAALRGDALEADVAVAAKPEGEGAVHSELEAQSTLSMSAQLRQMFKSTWMWATFLSSFTIAVTVTGLEVALPLYLTSPPVSFNFAQLGGGLGVLNICLALSNLVAGILCDKVGPERVLAVSIVLGSIMFPVMSFINSLLSAYLIMAAAGLLLGGLVSAPPTLVTKRAKMLGVNGGIASGFWYFFWGLGTAVGPTMAGLLSQHLSVLWVMICLSAFTVVHLLPISIGVCVMAVRERRAKNAQRLIETEEADTIN